MFRNAEIIFTGTFHGTVFSIKSKKQFYNYLANPSRIKKVSSLLSQFEIEDRKIENLNDYQKINYQKVFDIIKKYKNESCNYLINSIK